MPYDAAEITPTLRRQMLISALRGDMPVDWQWDFRIVGPKPAPCGSAGCAMGLAQHIGIITELEFIGDALALSRIEASRVFGISSYPVEPEHVTPAMVADALEALPPSSR